MGNSCFRPLPRVWKKKRKTKIRTGFYLFNDYRLIFPFIADILRFSLAIRTNLFFFFLEMLENWLSLISVKCGIEKWKSQTEITFAFNVYPSHIAQKFFFTYPFESEIVKMTDSYRRNIQYTLSFVTAWSLIGTQADHLWWKHTEKHRNVPFEVRAHICTRVLHCFVVSRCVKVQLGS